MWCSSCRADVAAELSTDNRRMLCARCQMELGLAAIEMPRVALAPRTVEAERDARELLARWSAQNLDAPLPTSSNPLPKPTPPNNDPDNTEVRRDGGRDQPLGSDPTPKSPYISALQERRDLSSTDQTQHEVSSPPESAVRREKKDHSQRPESSRLRKTPQLDLASTEDDSPQDHDRVVLNALQRQLNRGSNWATLAGQLCAYGGVCLLTCGTVLVMWSYFGGPPSYMPTGWLTAAVGQMLLFLGVVTLISSGMEQTIHEVSWRIDSLAEDVNRMSLSFDSSEDEVARSRRSRSGGTRSRSKENRRRDVA